MLNAGLYLLNDVNFRPCGSTAGCIREFTRKDEIADTSDDDALLDEHVDDGDGDNDVDDDDDDVVDYDYVDDDDDDDDAFVSHGSVVSFFLQEKGRYMSIGQN